MAESKERLWFGTVIDAVFIKGLGARVTPSLKADLKRLGIDLDRLRPAYPIEVVTQAFSLVTHQVFPGGHTFRVEWDE